MSYTKFKRAYEVHQLSQKFSPIPMGEPTLRELKT